MVSTRSSSSRADSAGPDSASPTASPTKSTTRAAAKRSTPSSSTSSSTTTAVSRRSGNTSARAAAAGRWAHTPTAFTLLWMTVSLPLVVWDTIYVLGRPHTMEGGWLHWPLWVPYKLYGEVDHVYGWKAVHAGSGFTAAQGFLNAVETAMYLAYVVAWWAARRRNAEGRLEGRDAAVAVLVGFSAAVMTLSKTVLYWMNEYYSGFDNIGHNSLARLIPLWIIPNGAWLVGSAYMIWSLGANIIDGLEAASGHAKSD
ncbi:hypothetical protein JDV02_000546 [Purpureocillium takamizusanense]|uniref:C6 transcription factor n=1 Tax=Purpureocillium takamizusanense TaxID=2060973 RepID=A0A9Q8V6I9_9HYPO|nr:uncharacterized protein JDV02_000546 [Purpureocillium takamizusanense]UNI13847.1 hypothetical protein JDV02_000546 [Purpureocillium takamizusanense]